MDAICKHNPQPRTVGKLDEEGNFILDFNAGVRPTPLDFWITPRWSPRPDLVPPSFASVDFETFYTPTYSLTSLSTWTYVTHHAFDAYLVSICKAVGNRWRVWVGHPMDAPWGGIAGLPWVSHNAEFDDLVHQRLVRDGLIPAIRPPIWECTSDLGMYLQAGRSLADVARVLFGITVDKTSRAQQLGQRTTTEGFTQYTAMDAIVCAEIWYNYAAYWPLIERHLSRMTRLWGWQGVHIDKASCETDIGKLEFAKHEIKQKLPWAKKGKSVASIVNVRNQCFREGITPPPNLDLDNDGTAAWVDQYAGRFPWVALIRDHTQCHQMAGFMRLLLERRRADGTVPYNLNYFGAPHTARWTSGKRLRMQNLNRAGKLLEMPDKKLHEVNLRAKFVPPPGEVFLIADSSQIEPRVLNWLTGNTPFLQMCMSGINPYEAHARLYMGYDGTGLLKKTDPVKYLLAKYQYIGLGYQCAAEKYCIMAKAQGLSVALDRPLMIGPKQDVWEMRDWDRAVNENRLLTPPETYGVIPPAIETVTTFRRNMPLVVNYWSDNEKAIRACLGRDYIVNLPSGGTIRYFDVREEYNPFNERKEIVADVIKNPVNPKNKKSFYGGKLVENLVQRVARDILAYFVAVISVRMPDVKIRWHVHDEIIASCPRQLAEKNLALMLQIMHTPPPWAVGLPVAAEGSIETCYTK